LPISGRPQDQDIVVLLEPLPARQRPDQGAIEAPGRPVVDVLQARRLAQSREAQALGERGVLPVDLLAVDQDAEPLVERQPLAVGLAELLFQGLGHADQAQAA